MLKLTRWCIAHRGRVFVAWVVVAVVTTVLAGAAGRNYATNFSLPGTESQRALDLLKKEFPAQSGDVDTVVFHTANGTIDDPDVKAAMTKLLGAGVGRPARRLGAESLRPRTEPSRSRATARPRSRRSTTTSPRTWCRTTPASRCSIGVNAVDVPGLKVAAGGQVIENAEGFSVGPATVVGVDRRADHPAVHVRLAVAAGLPLITAGLGLITGVALIGLATHVTSMPNVSTDLALMIGLGVGIDYALFIVTRFREEYLALGRRRERRPRGDGHVRTGDPAGRRPR